MHCDPEKHKEHFCFRSGNGKNMLQRLAPAFECGCCGARANTLDKLCEPVEVSKMIWAVDGSDAA